MSSNSIQQLLFPRSGSLTTLVFLVVMAVLAVYATSVQADGDVMGGGEGGEMTAMADAIKYLQGLDKVYGQAARPSIRGGKIVQLLQLKQLDRRYDNSLVRPRFGKRGRLPYFDLEYLPVHPQHAY
ncbi:uncharacterized protein LOC130697008 [Daphnia carinata]|uniref:uncharacterized protein LOC130697008 n=1 Tax=Daphnia carinata TaxID=120202 RepID=UPI00257C76B3|nr:uncharacterized protein LOC130697008 [Daphnia carinata]